MSCYDYLEAWGAWWTGITIQERCLWDIKILYLARAGKMLCAIAGVVIVIDIVGEDKFRRIGRDIFSFFEPYKLITILVSGMGLFPMMSAFWLLGVFSKISNYNSSEENYITNLLAVGVSWMLVLPTALLGIIVIPFLIILFLLSISWILSLRLVGNLLRIASLSAFCIGFHFDLLGS